MIEALINLVQKQHTHFIHIFDHQQILINNLQADLANTKKYHDGKINAVMDLGIDNYALLDEKLDQLGVVIIRKTDEVMKHAEEKFIESVPTIEEVARRENIIMAYGVPEDLHEADEEFKRKINRARGLSLRTDRQGVGEQAVDTSTEEPPD